MKIKVCGMRDPDNIKGLVNLSPDYIGFIFQAQSKRYVSNGISEEIRKLIPGHIQKTGVFVNEPLESIIKKYNFNRLEVVQLHGDEDPEYCRRLKKLNIPVIKAFKISGDFDFTRTEIFESCCDYFLFDTAGKTAGGTGVKFDWKLLDQYKGGKSFFLSGGITALDFETIVTIKHPKLYGIDLNSGFEIEPGLKDIVKLETFIEKLRQNQYY